MKPCSRKLSQPQWMRHETTSLPGPTTCWHYTAKITPNPSDPVRRRLVPAVPYRSGQQSLDRDDASHTKSKAIPAPRPESAAAPCRHGWRRSHESAWSSAVLNEAGPCWIVGLGGPPPPTGTRARRRGGRELKSCPDGASSDGNASGIRQARLTRAGQGRGSPETPGTCTCRWAGAGRQADRGGRRQSLSVARATRSGRHHACSWRARLVRQALSAARALGRFE